MAHLLSLAPCLWCVNIFSSDCARQTRELWENRYLKTLRNVLGWYYLMNNCSLKFYWLYSWHYLFVSRVGGFTLLFVPCNQTCMVRVVRLLFLLRCLKSGEPANGEAQLICLIGKESLQPMELQEGSFICLVWFILMLSWYRLFPFKGANVCCTAAYMEDEWSSFLETCYITRKKRNLLHCSSVQRSLFMSFPLSVFSPRTVEGTQGKETLICTMEWL